jgi:hypothetical protein
MTLQYAEYKESQSDESNNNINNSKKSANATRKKKHTKDNDLVNRIKLLQEKYIKPEETKVEDNLEEDLDKFEKALNYQDEDDDSRQFLPPPEISQTKTDDSKNITHSQLDISKFHDPYVRNSELVNDMPSRGENPDFRKAGEQDRIVESYIDPQYSLNAGDNLGNYTSMSNNGQGELLEKMNKIIHLLEEQHDERTNNVTEELILYCFLGVFVIYIVDSFARAGKYTR